MSTDSKNGPAASPSSSFNAYETRDPDALETERAAANFLGVTTRALQKWRVTGTGPQFVRISGRCIRYRRCDLMAWTEARLKSSTVE